jgi:hypothetical protein
MLSLNCELRFCPQQSWNSRAARQSCGFTLTLLLRSTRLGRTLFTCVGGHLALPEKGLALLSREDGGNLLVLPSRDVWERGELTPADVWRQFLASHSV